MHGRRGVSVHSLSALVMLALALVSPACEPSPAPSLRGLVVAARDDEGRALPGIPVELDGIATTRTGEAGTARISLSASGPARARIGVRCGAASRDAPPRTVTRAQAGGSGWLELTFTCRPLLRRLVVVVRAPGAQGAWLRADGQPVARIESDGTLHASLERAPESELRLMLDTGGLPLSPRNPVLDVRVPDRDELIVFDQALVPTRAASRRKPAPAPRREAPSALPYAIQGHGR